ncbi:Zinc finger CCCH domain-containing protein 59 [Platanthera zijinensis]|uniref:Zinc finger CCCH domain-containing protein 59 n=1 Tax=Platanthera zijinensis TaxID=2320716 RepID=A0AAP0AZX0_9ASPA
MAAASPPRILLCGDVLGRLNQLFKRVQSVPPSSSVNKSTGPFDALLCVGQFFPDSADALEEVANYLDGWSPVPIPTYFIGDYGAGGSRFLSAVAELPSNKGFKKNGLEVCPNLYWLKGSGKFSLHGLSIMYLSGRQFPDIEGKGRYSRDDVDALRALAEEPGPAPPRVPDPLGSDPVLAELALEIKPRYHIAGTKAIFFAREPYSNVDAVYATRFIGLATVGNKEKMKFIHAISPTPASTLAATEICLKQSNTTLSPYTVGDTTNNSREQTKRPAKDDSENQYWRFDISKKRPRQDGVSGERLCFKYMSSGVCPQGEKCSYRHDEDAREQYHKNVCFDFLNKGKCERGPQCRFRHNLVEEGDALSKEGQGSQNGKSYRRIPEKNCWFCLSSPHVEAHLVISIGGSYYCALAKGPLVQDHVLLIPIEHHPNTLTSSLEAEAELEKYKNALKIYFKNQEKAVVFFEWIFRSSPHTNLQAVPIPFSKASTVQKIFTFAAKKLGFEISLAHFLCPKAKKARGGSVEKSVFFLLPLPLRTRLLHHATIQGNDAYPIQFYSEQFSKILSMNDNRDFRQCKYDGEVEVKGTEIRKSRRREKLPKQ